MSIPNETDVQDAIVGAIHAEICESSLEECRDDAGGDCFKAAAAVRKAVADWSVGEPRVLGGQLFGLHHHECGRDEYFDRGLSGLLGAITTHDCMGGTR